MSDRPIALQTLPREPEEILVWVEFPSSLGMCDPGAAWSRPSDGPASFCELRVREMDMPHLEVEFGDEPWPSRCRRLPVTNLARSGVIRVTCHELHKWPGALTILGRKVMVDARNVAWDPA